MYTLRGALDGKQCHLSMSRLSSSAAPADEQWFVAMAGEVRTMTVDQLDQAFQTGAIDVRTAVWTEGMHGWSTLGAVAQLESSTGPSHIDVELDEDDQTATLPGRQPRPAAEPQPIANDVSLWGVADSSVPLSFSPSAWGSVVGPSTGAVVRTLSEPVIPIRRHEEGPRFKLWAAAAAAVLGLLLYAGSVLRFSADAAIVPKATAATAQSVSVPPAPSTSNAADLMDPPRASTVTVATPPPPVAKVDSTARAKPRPFKKVQRKSLAPTRKAKKSAVASRLSKKRTAKSTLSSRSGGRRRATQAAKAR